MSYISACFVSFYAWFTCLYYQICHFIDTFLQLRLEQILVTKQDPLLAYRLSNLIRFYAHVIPRIIGRQAKLSLLLEEYACGHMFYRPCIFYFALFHGLFCIIL